MQTRSEISSLVLLLFLVMCFNEIAGDCSVKRAIVRVIWIFTIKFNYRLT